MDIKHSPAEKRFVLLLLLQCLTLAVALFAVWGFWQSKSESSRPELIRETAAKLQAAGLTHEAIAQYEEYAKESKLEPATRANIAFILGQLYESEGQPEKALASFYKVEGSDPSSPQQKDAAKRIVAILEALGRHQAAKSVLAGATSLEGNKPEVGKPVAEIGDKKISLEELDASLDGLPPQLKGEFSGAEGKKNFLKKYVADELLFEKAERLGYDSDPKWIKELEQLKRQALVARVLNEDVFSKVNFDEKDVKNYYEANKTKYTKGKKDSAFEKVKEAVEQDYRLEKSQVKYQELINSLVTGDSVKLFPENVK